MNKVMFVCLGNVCRSPMAELVFKDLVEKQHLGHEFHIESSGTNSFRENSPVHIGTKKKLNSVGISSSSKKSQQFQKSHYDQFDWIVCMDESNVNQVLDIIGKDSKHKISKLLDYTNHPGDIADPWYTDDFDSTYSDVIEGCEGLLKAILKSQSFK
jgi:protein-tyrosine phosphatase